jgi:hypothetical protein
MLCRHFQPALVLAVLCSGAANVARADEADRAARPATSDILEVTEETCLTREKVGERLTPLLPATPLPQGLRITLRVDADSKTTFVVSVPGEDVGVRSFDTSGLTCENKLKVVSFAIAVAIEGIMESRAARLREPQVPPAPGRAVPPRPIPPPRPRVPGAAWTVGLGEGLFTTRLGSSAAVLVSLARDTSVYGLRLSLLQTLGATVHVDPGSVRYTLTLARLHACANVIRIRTFVGRACALAGAGPFDARGTGFFAGGAGRSLWVDAGASAEGNIALSRRWALRGSIAPSAILRGPTLTVTDASSGGVTARSDVPRIGVLFALELAFRFDE